MESYYGYRVDKGMMELSEVPEPYQTMLRNKGYTDKPTEY